MFPDAADRKLVLNWLAWDLENLDKKPKHALVITGEIQGTGNSIISDIFAGLIGSQNVTPVEQRTLELPHNGWDLHTKLIVCEEVRATGAIGRNGISKKLHSGSLRPVSRLTRRTLPPLTINDVIRLHPNDE